MSHLTSQEDNILRADRRYVPSSYYDLTDEPPFIQLDKEVELTVQPELQEEIDVDQTAAVEPDEPSLKEVSQILLPGEAYFKSELEDLLKSTDTSLRANIPLNEYFDEITTVIPRITPLASVPNASIMQTTLDKQSHEASKTGVKRNMDIRYKIAIGSLFVGYFAGLGIEHFIV